MKKNDVCEIDGTSYTVESKLGQGGASNVWRVRSSADGRAYALKQIRKLGGSAKRDERFRNEIRFGIESEHPYVVKVHAWAEDDSSFYYVMDLYSASLRQVITEELADEVLLDYISQLCEGLMYVHGEGIVHRDIKPENILVDTANRRLVIADFGIAHFKNSSLTKQDEVLANRNYQAPEQMAKKHPNGIGAPADVFALGLITTEMFTKQNARGARHLRVRDIHPFLSALDDLVERMTLQDDMERIDMRAARDTVELIRRQVRSHIDVIVKHLRTASTPPGGHSPDSERVLMQAARDVLSAKHIFERSPDDESAGYNRNYHCEVSFSAGPELLNLCVQSQLYRACKAKFENEMRAVWDEAQFHALARPGKAAQLQKFEELQARFPLPRDSLWDWAPPLAAHYFRFCMDYHCEELLNSAREIVADKSEAGPSSLEYNLIDAPILWIARSARRYLTSEGLEIDPSDLELLKFEKQVSINWSGTSLGDAPPAPHSRTLLEQRLNVDAVPDILNTLREEWGVSVGERTDGRFSVFFSSRAVFDRFRDRALEMAAPHYVFEGDVEDLLRPVAEYDDLVAFVWEPEFTIRVTLAKLLGLREIDGY